MTGESSESLGRSHSSGQFIIDASVAIKWYLPEVHSEAARRFLDGAWELHVPDLIYPEVGNILWKKVRRTEISDDEARAIVRALSAVPLSVHVSSLLWGPALEIALQTGRSVYDSLYVALAVLLGARLVTADEKLRNALNDGPFRSHILWVGEEFNIINNIIYNYESAGDFQMARASSPYYVEQIELLMSGHTGEQLKDADLRHLGGLPELQELYLSNPAITDAGLAHLEGLVHPKTLDLKGTGITDSGLLHLRGLIHLESLNLRGTGVTDIGRPHLLSLKNLRKLVLWDTKITDMGLAHLKGLSHLKEIDLSDTRVTDAGVEDFHQALPVVRISR